MICGPAINVMNNPSHIHTCSLKSFFDSLRASFFITPISMETIVFSNLGQNLDTKMTESKYNCEDFPSFVTDQKLSTDNNSYLIYEFHIYMIIFNH